MVRNYQKDKTTKTKNAAAAHSSASMMRRLFTRPSTNNNPPETTVTPAVTANENDVNGIDGVADLELELDDGISEGPNIRNAANVDEAPTTVTASGVNTNVSNPTGNTDDVSHHCPRIFYGFYFI